MLKKLGKMLVVAVAAASMLFVAVPMADANGAEFGPPGYYLKVKGGGPQLGTVDYKDKHPIGNSEWVFIGDTPPPQTCSDCNDVVVAAAPGDHFGFVSDVHSSDMAAGAAIGNVNLTALGIATGQNIKIWRWEIPGTGWAWAVGYAKLDGKVFVLAFTNGEQGPNGGLSFTKAITVGILEFDADILATGGMKGIFGPGGCPQYTKAELEGIFGVMVSGYSLSESINGSFAGTSFEADTRVKVHAFDENLNTFSILGVSSSHTSIHGKVVVMQGGLALSYVSADGMTTANFGIITGGSAFSHGDADILGIRSNGNVMQSGQAVGSAGTAYGWSSASYSGAEGYVSHSGNYANGSGLAVVKGYNNVTQTGNSVSLTSYQSAFATTGGNLLH